METETIILISAIAGLLILFATIKALTPVMLSKQHERYLRAAQQGDFNALCELALEYYNDEYRNHFKQHPAQAVNVFNAAKRIVEVVECKSDDREPIDEDYYLLGLMYEEGFGTEKDTVKAVEYFNKTLEFIKSLNLSEEDAFLFEERIKIIKKKIQQYS